MKLLERLKAHSVEHLTRLACIVALVGLAVMVAPILRPKAVMVMFAMGAGHVIGAVAFLLYLLSIVLDVSRNAARRRSLLPPERAPTPVSNEVDK